MRAALSPPRLDTLRMNQRGHHVTTHMVPRTIPKTDPLESQSPEVEDGTPEKLIMERSTLPGPLDRPPRLASPRLDAN